MTSTSFQFDHDVAVVGAGPAGCAAAKRLAEQGARVVLIERNGDPTAFKTACSHFIQPGATPALERLGLAGPMEAAGAVRNRVALWTRYGWTPSGHGADYPHSRYGYNLRRAVLDPLVRRLAADTPGVDLLLGHGLRGLRSTDGRVTGVEVARRDGTERTLRARLVIGADGRSSRVAALAGTRARTRAHGRFTYWAYYEGLPTDVPGQFWFRDPGIAYRLPNDAGQTLVSVWETMEHLPGFRSDPETGLRRAFESLPDAPDLSAARRVSKVMGKLDMPNVARAVTQPGLALVGDAALATDPVWGVGLGWAFESAEWLADEVAEALLGDDAELDRALTRYRRRHRRALAAHHWMNCDYATGRRFRPPERLLFAAAARDQQTSDHLHAYASRCIGVPSFLSPGALARAAWVTGVRRSRPLTSPSEAARGTAPVPAGLPFNE